MPDSADREAAVDEAARALYAAAAEAAGVWDLVDRLHAQIAEVAVWLATELTQGEDGSWRMDRSRTPPPQWVVAAIDQLRDDYADASRG